MTFCLTCSNKINEKRLNQRNLIKKENYSLNQTAKNAGIKNFNKFYNAK